MAESPAGQGAEHWKKKYYDQLDRLDQKEEEWAKLESVLKRAIGRLSLAAEGQGQSLDRHIRDIRAVVRDKVNRQRLENILDDLSKLLAKMEEKRSTSDKQVVASLGQLLASLTLPAQCEKAKKKLVKHLDKSTDEESDGLLKDVVDLLGRALKVETAAVATEKKPGLLDRLLGSSDGAEKIIDYQATAALTGHVLGLLPWPDDISAAARQAIEKTSTSNDDKSLSNSINELEKLIAQWKALPASTGKSPGHTAEPVSLATTPAPTASELDIYRQCVLSFMDKLDDPASPNGRLAALRTLARDAGQQQQLENLSAELATLLSLVQVDSAAPAQVAVPGMALQPSIQELLIRLLEQLVVPPDLNADVDTMKAQLEAESDPADWKKLLKEVAVLINSIRSRMQKEKHEFEDFLQQITGRLKEMDEFLQIESSSLKNAQKQGQVFDAKMHNQVQDIRDDVTQASDLNTLKGFVETKLDVISQHIRDYRNVETERLQDAQKNLADMQDKMVSLEQETHSLKKVIVEKNKLAMFDVLTGIPNRLAYEKKVAEEIARWKRFQHPLSIAIWDVDLFKKVNDTFGHKAGDKVLKTVAQLLNDRIRETDFLARYGGEEFVMLLPGTKQEETLRLVNDLRERVESCGFHYHGDPVNITVSCGVSSFQQDDTLEQVFERADQALYKAKNNGRNQCVVASCLSD